MKNVNNVFRAGGTAGAVITCPLEVVKTRLQSSVATFSQNQSTAKQHEKPIVLSQRNYSTYPSASPVPSTSYGVQLRTTPSLWSCIRYSINIVCWLCKVVLTARILIAANDIFNFFFVLTSDLSSTMKDTAAFLKDLDQTSLEYFLRGKPCLFCIEAFIFIVAYCWSAKSVLCVL